MHHPEEELLGILNKAGVNFTSSLPCEKIKNLLEIIIAAYSSTSLPHVPLTREEEGVGICAGACLAGKRPAMFVQSSGIGNMINALLSLTAFYELPLAVFVSLRGVYKEKIEAQFPMGRRLPGILQGAGIPYSVINTAADFKVVGKKLDEIYTKNKIHAFLLSPAIWEKSGVRSQRSKLQMQDLECGVRSAIQCAIPPFEKSIRRSPAARSIPSSPSLGKRGGSGFFKGTKPKFTRFEILKIVAPYLDSKIVVCNLGFPSKELFHIQHQPSNFYMLGSMGMATPIGLGVSLSSKKEVFVIDGDGSLLMNPGTLATAAYMSPENLTILAVDNSAYGSTGNQPTLTGSCVDLEAVAQGFGIRNTCKVATRKELTDVLKNPAKGLRFVHILAVSGNKDLPAISLNHLEIKRQVQKFIRET